MLDVIDGISNINEIIGTGQSKFYDNYGILPYHAYWNCNLYSRNKICNWHVIFNFPYFVTAIITKVEYLLLIVELDTYFKTWIAVRICCANKVISLINFSNAFDATIKPPHKSEKKLKYFLYSIAHFQKYNITAKSLTRHFVLDGLT